MRDRALATDATTTSSRFSLPLDHADLRTGSASLVEQAGDLRNRARLVQADSDRLHQDALTIQLEVRTAERAKLSMQSLLELIGEAGFSWRDVARLVGVSVPALRKWRAGESATGVHRSAVAQLVAFTDLIAEQGLIQDVASWLEVPIVPDVPVTHLDLYAVGLIGPILEHAMRQLSDPSGLLDLYDPEWRGRYRSEFEVFEASDGEPALRRRA